jgi:hypothetical protein
MKNYKTEVKWAIIFAVMTLLWMLMEKLGGYHDKNIAQHAFITNFIMIPAITIYVLALKEKKNKDFNGRMTYKQGLKSGFILSIMITLLGPITQSITSLVITPDYFKFASEYAVSTGKLTQEGADAYFNLGSYIIQGLIGAPVMGIITSALVAFFTIKKQN